MKSEGGRKRLIIDYRGLPYGPDVAQFSQAMKDVVEKLREVDADEVVLSEYYERIYNEEQTNWLKQVADLLSSLEADAVWSPSHLGKSTASKVLAPRHDAVLKILNMVSSDPFKAYLTLVQELKNQMAALSALEGEDADDLKIYVGTLKFMRQKIEGIDLIQKMKNYLTQLGSIPEGRTAYHTFFESAIKPSFIGSRIFFTGTEGLELVDQYEVLGTKVYVYKHPDRVELLYYINPPEYSLPPEKYFLLEKTKEVVAQHRPDTVEFMDIAQARKYFRKVYVATIADLALKNNIELSVEEKEDLATIVARYTIGYGILEILLSDRRVTDVYIDSPLGVKPVYLVHGKYGQCQTNVIFSNEEARSIVSRFRALSGRPFDEAHPILDFDLEDLQTRIAVIGKPLALDGIAFALRLHKTTPWTLAQFVDNNMFSALNAGMFSFFVDAQASMLIVGSRGAGKTSMLQSLMLELPQNLRILVQEDSVTGGTPIVVEKNGKLMSTTVGILVDGLIEKHGKVLFNGVEKLPSNPEKIKVFSSSPDGELQLADVSCFIRHKTTKELYLVKTESYKEIKVTGDHSLFTFEQGRLKAVKTTSLQCGDDLVVADCQLNSNDGTISLSRRVSLEKIAEITNLGQVNDYVYDFSVPHFENFVCAGILAHNTQELPIPALKRLGYSIQRLKTRPPLGGGTETEVSAEDALRTALRLGDSVLIVGEVRSGEAKALYEAMRVGAVGNVVMGTIHGESAYGIWDRVVNDLGVPTTSFKATDFCLVSAPIRFKGSLKRHRRVIELTEVLKHWDTDPGKEDGFQSWLAFNAEKDALEFFEDQVKENSEWLKKTRQLRGLTYEDIMSEITARGITKQYLVDQKRKFDIPQLLEADYAVRAHNKYLLLSEKQREEIGGVDHKLLLAEWKKWVDDSLIKDLINLKKT